MIHDQTYLKMLNTILTTGDAHDDRTGVGTTSLFGYQCIYDLKDGFPLLTTKRMAWNSIVTELRWFLLGRTDNAWLTERKCNIWNEWADTAHCAKFGRIEGDLGPIYGKQWRNYGANQLPNGDYEAGTGVDQIKQLCNDLVNNPNSRRLIVTGWNPAEATKVALPPCHTLWQCKVRTVGTDKYLDLQLYQRSADCFLGVPFNIASYALLLKLLAHTHGMHAGRFIHTFGDLHVYNNHREQCKEQLSRWVLHSPTLVLNLELGFDGLMKWAETGEGVQLINYTSHPSIKAPVAV